MVVLRGGIVARLRLFYDFEVRGNFIPLLKGRDKLGLGGGDAFQIGLRWRWASDGSDE